MDGFFSSKETDSFSSIKGKQASCPSCGLYKYVFTPRMKPFGNFKKRILNIGEAPGEVEDQRGRQWQGKTGRLLEREYRRHGIDLFEDCLNINSINCRPTDKEGNNRTPSPHEINCCRKRVLEVIQQYQPHIIMLLGGTAVQALIGYRWKKDLGGIMKWRGWNIPDRDFKAWICPVFHPSYVERKSSQEINTIWKQDIRKAFSLLHTPFPNFPDEKNQVEIIDSPDLLDPFPELVEIDYETTGLKPHAPGHRIICASVAYNENAAQVFMMPPSQGARERFLKLLRAKDIGKMAHNMKFEEHWSVVRLRQPVQNWLWDSMQMAHILDNRPSISSLKFQTYVHFGVVDYDSEISSYLQGVDSKNGNSLNRIQELIKTPQGKKKLCIYCGMDALFGYKLAQIQMPKGYYL